MLPLSKLQEAAPLVISLSLLTGLCWTIGTCMALGSGSFYYVSTTDFLRNAMVVVPIFLTISPIMIIIGHVGAKDQTVRQTMKLVQQAGPNKIRAYSIAAIRELLYYIPLLFISVWALRSPTLSELFTVISIFVVVVVGGVLTFAGPQDGLFKSWILITMCAACIVLVAEQNQIDVQRRAELSAAESVCFADKCSRGTVLARFSEASFLWLEHATGITVVRNEEIKSVKALGDKRLKPLWERSALLHKVQKWFIADEDARPARRNWRQE